MKNLNFHRIALSLGAALAVAVSTAPVGAEEGLSAEEQARIDAMRSHLDAVQAQGKIVNGVPADEDDFPWAASIAFRTTGGSFFSFCGGSLIAPEWVVTAAHCKVEKSDKVILGRLDLRTSAGKVHNIAESITHPDYDPSTNNNDIALVRLTQASDHDPIPLIGPTGAAAPPEADFTVAGWGLLEEGGEASPVLMKVTVPILTNPACAADYANAGVGISLNMLCAGQDGKDSCQGDSGGPGMVDDPTLGDFRLAGVVSFGIGCAREGFPGVYTRVSRYLTWIKDNTGVEPPAEGCNCG